MHIPSKLMSAIVSYFNGSLEELKLVRWPTQQQAIRLTVITLVFIVVSSAFFGLLDALFTELIRLSMR